MKTNSKPKRSILGIPSAVQQVKVIRLTWWNVLSLIGVGLLLVLWLMNMSQPKLGEQLTIDQFLRNIKTDSYSAVEIRNDGNAVGYGKYIHTSPANDVQVDSSSKVVPQTTLESHSLEDLLKELKPATSLSESFARFIASINDDGIKDLYVADKFLLVDWNKKTDWLIDTVGESQLVSKLNASNLDVAQLNIKVNYLRAAALPLGSEDITSGFANKKYSAAWVIDGNIYARVESGKGILNYVNFGTALSRSDFTELLQSEGISLTTGNVSVTVLPVNQIDFLVVGQILFLVLLGVFGFMMLRGVKGSDGGLMKFGQSKARMFFGQKMQITFKDVAGVDEAKEELKEVVDFLRNPLKYQKLGAKIPRGVLMVGEPGTGKTLLARAIAGEAGVPFFHTSGSEFEEMLVGAGASRVRDLFDKAKKASPSLIFIDEIDAVGRKRGTTIQSSSTEQTLNQILVEMDGFEVRDNVIVIAATNRPDVLDPALLRPGRFDRKVVLDQPDINGRKAILEIHAKGKPFAAEVDMLKVSKRTVGFSGADLANMLNEAAIIVAKEDRTEITMADIEEAATKVQSGPIRRRSRSQDELKMTAYHEAAHALVMKLTPQSDPVYRITILSRGMALGYTMPLPETDQLQMTKTKMESKITALLAGFTAEDMVFGDVTTGASNDIERATSIANQMVKRFGMSKKLGLVNYGATDTERMGWGAPDKEYSEATAEIIDVEVRRIIQESHEAAKKILTSNRAILDKLAESLLKQEVIEADEFKEFFA